MNNKKNVVGIPISVGGVDNVHNLFSQKPPNQSLITTFVNPHSCYLDKTIPGYAKMLQAFDIVACDGIGMVKAARTSGCKDMRRESFDFSSLAGDVMRAAVDLGLSIGLIGGKPGISHSAAKELSKEYPGLKVVGCYSGYQEDPQKARHFFINHEVELVICGMGAPLQEKFLMQLVSEGWSGTGFTCGGFLDQVVNPTYSYPDWIDRHDLRFLYRLYKEPRRLWRRYLVEYQVFLWRYGKLLWLKALSKLKRVKYSGEVR